MGATWIPPSFESMGLTPIINAAGPATRLGGFPMDPRVAEAMRLASTRPVRMEELQRGAGRRIAESLGTESALVTCGAGAGLALAAAACIAGYDVSTASSLPHLPGDAPAVCMLRSQRYPYDRLVTLSGAHIRDIGYPEATRAYEVAEGTRAGCVALLYYPHRSSPGVSFGDVVRECHSNGVPVIVDLAMEDPPPILDRSWVDSGADLIVFSGGKFIGGPQASGVLAGRSALIESALLQSLDMDVHEETWVMAEQSVAGEVLGPPHHGLGRAMKVGKEEIMGLLAAVGIYLERDHDAERAVLMRRAEEFAHSLQKSGVNVAVQHGAYSAIVTVSVPEPPKGPGIWPALRALQRGEPCIHLNESRADEGLAVVDLRGVSEVEADALRRAVVRVVAGGPDIRGAKRLDRC